MSLNIIVAFSHKTFGIGIQNRLPWNIPADLHYFNMITKNSVVIMGKNTWLSIPASKRPLKNRRNVVVSSSNDDPFYVTMDYVDALISDVVGDVFIVGGESLYKKYIGIADNIYATIIEKEFEADRHFPMENFGQYQIQSYSSRFISPEENCYYRHVVYEKRQEGKPHPEQCYINMIRTVMSDGEQQLDRTKIGTRCIFAPDPLRFDVSQSIPLFTSKFINFRMIVEELLWFLRGETDAGLLEEKGVNIWKPNTTREFLDKRGLENYEENDIGSMYGWIWNHIGADYRGCSADYTGQGINQIQMLIKNLREDPSSRRHLITTFCPIYSDQGCLMPCHGIVCQFHVSNDKSLSCHVYNRSQDVFLGQPFNVASYSVLLYIIAAKCGYKPCELVMSLGNTHIYSNHETQCREQLTRPLLPLPKLELSENVVASIDFKDLTIDDFKLVGYVHHPGIRGAMAI